MTISDAHDGRAEFKITVPGSAWEDDTNQDEFSEAIEFEYSNPAVSIDSSGRFAVHEIIGGTTVRQKIGEDPLEIDINGVCKESTARELDNLRNATYGSITGDRLPQGGTMTVQFESVSTSPHSNSGSMPIDPDVNEFLYTFTLACTEITPSSYSGSDGSDSSDGSSGSGGSNIPDLRESP